MRVFPWKIRSSLWQCRLIFKSKLKRSWIQQHILSALEHCVNTVARKSSVHESVQYSNYCKMAKILLEVYAGFNSRPYEL